MKRVTLTDKEVDLIFDMAAIAGAGTPGEGDYQDWTDKEYYTALNRLIDKLRDAK